jgi:hypothetical protein
MGAFFTTDFFGGNPATITQTPSIAAPTPSSSSGGGSSTLDWLNTIYKFAQLGTSTYLAQDALDSKGKTVVFGANGQPTAIGGGSVVQPTGVNSILATSSIWLFLFVIVVVLLLVKK